MVKASGVDAEIHAKQVPVLPAAHEFAAASVIPGGSVNNLDYVSDSVTWAADLSRATQILLCDAQTSGGLLISVDESESAGLVKQMHESGILEAAVIGRISVAGGGRITVV
jgi:selenide,water dikinase